MESSQTYPNVFNAACGTRSVLDLLANKWTILIISALADGSLRYGQLRRTLDGITPKMLAQTLHQLERDGLITRVVHPTNPPTVEYSLSEIGAKLIEPFAGLCRWAEGHLAEVEQARVDYDKARSERHVLR